MHKRSLRVDGSRGASEYGMEESVDKRSLRVDGSRGASEYGMEESEHKNMYESGQTWNRKLRSHGNYLS